VCAFGLGVVVLALGCERRWGLGDVRLGRCVGVGVRVRVGVRVGREYGVLRERCVWVRVAVRVDGARGVGFGVAVRV
jgi:hypothetical protein